MTFRAASLFETFARAIEDAGAKTVAIDLDAFDPQASVEAHTRRLGPLLAGATASILIAPERPSAALSMAVAKAAEKEGARHVHLLAVDERMLGQSVRADPDLLAIVNRRLGDALRPPSSVRATSEFGTDLEVRLALTHPILSSIGRPDRGASENLPAGVVYLHPARVSGTLVVDRAIFGPGIALDRSLLRRAPARIEMNGNRMTDFSSSEPAVMRAIEAYLASHAEAARIGMLLFPTNYLVRSDVGSDRQDMLLPGMGLSMGYSSRATTGANYEAPVQMVLLGRRQSVEVDGKKLVDAGRLTDFLVEGIDPFR
jgi:leucyl aminopeptidase (aminopeptidase T)